MDRIIFHIDVNSAYLSWTSVHNLRTGSGPDYRQIPAIIGGDRESRHGVVLAKSLPAKAYGIHTGEPVASALRKCPGLVIALPDHSMYRQFSRELFELLYTYTPDLEQVSIDECYMEFTGISHLYESPVAAARLIKDNIRNSFGFTVNVGISCNKLLAKMASDFEKPDKVHTLFPDEIPLKMWPLPVEELYMAGHSSVETLHKLGIRTIGELAATDPELLAAHLKSHGHTLWEYANGIDDSPVDSGPGEAKGIGNSTTLSNDVTDRAEAFLILHTLAESVARRLRNAHQIAGSVCVEIKYNTFQSTSKQMQLPSPLNTADGIYKSSCLLFDRLWDGSPIRLLGIRSSKLLEDTAPVQMSLFDYGLDLSNSDPSCGRELKDKKSAKDSLLKDVLLEGSLKNEKQKKLDSALDSIRKRYGSDAVIRGSLLQEENEEAHKKERGK